MSTHLRHLRDRPSGAGQRPSQAAFTLIELLVVMIIVAILMAIAVPTFLSQKNTALRTKAVANMRMIQHALEACSASIDQNGGYTGCAEHSYLYSYEPSLKDLPKCCSRQIEGEYDINGVTDTNARVGTPTPTQPIAGYEVFTWFNDGDTELWFQLVHWPDGEVTKRCGAGKRPPWDRVAMPGVKGSRICQTGTW